MLLADRRGESRMPIHTHTGRAPATPAAATARPFFAPFSSTPRAAPPSPAADLDAQIERAARFGHSLERLAEPAARAGLPDSRSPIQLGRKKRSRAVRDEEVEDEPKKGKEQREDETGKAKEEDVQGQEKEEAPAKRRKLSPRSRARDDLSEGESENEDEDILFRSLRAEEDPFEHGLLPPEGHDPDITAKAHVSAGSRAKRKSPWVSLSRSRKVAAAWASENRGGRVAKVRIPKELRESGNVLDLTDPEQAKSVFPTLKGSTYNTAKSSQEVLVKGGLGKEHVLDVLRARKLSVKEYGELDESDPNLYAKLRTRKTTKQRPLPRVLERIPEK
jgi:hypothetical protein